MAISSPFSLLAESLGGAFGLGADSINTASQLGGIFGGLYSSNQYAQAGDIAAQGGALSATSYRQAGDTSVEFAKYNSKIVSANLAQQMSDLAAQQRSLMGTQRAQMASTGISMTSQSYLAIASASIDSYARKAQSLSLSAAIQNQSTLFQGELSRVQAENQARLATYQGDLNRYQQQQSQSNQDFQNIASIASFFLL